MPVRRRRPVRGASEEEASRAGERVDESAPPIRPDAPVAAHPALADVRLHRDQAAAELTAGLGAEAVTAGPHVYLSPKAPAPDTPAGRRLLAHELTHVVQQHEFGTRTQLFTAAERPWIADDLAAMMAVVQAIVDASSNGSQVMMDSLVRHAGGATAGPALPGRLKSADPPGMSMLTLRYLFTSRCGLVDMRHFFQLMYIAWFTDVGNAGMAARGATRRGVEHERTSESTSKFAPEDLTSNALGAWTATRLAALPQRYDLVARIRETLERCGPVRFSSLSPGSQDAIVAFYAAHGGAGEPLYQNTSAVALVPEIPELAAAERSFPFDLDSDDPSRATIEGPAFTGGAAALTGDDEIRRFVDVQREQVLRAITQGDRVRLCVRLTQGWVSDADLDAFERLYRLGDGSARSAIRAAIPSTTLFFGQRARLRMLYEGLP